MRRKRIFDIIASLIGLAVLFPVFLLIALTVKFTSGGPVFFRQFRVGQFSKLFLIVKFRTMVINAFVLLWSVTSKFWRVTYDYDTGKKWEL